MKRKEAVNHNRISIYNEIPRKGVTMIGDVEGTSPLFQIRRKYNSYSVINR